MGNKTRLAQLCALLLCVVLACALPVAAGESWAAVDSSGAVRVVDGSNRVPPALLVRSDKSSQLQVEVATQTLPLRATSTSGGEFLDLAWDDASIEGEVGEPALPVIRRLFVAPPGAEVSVTWQAGEEVAVDLRQANLPSVRPVQPPVPKVPGAAEAAVFQLDESAYRQTEVFPAERATVTELGIVRGERLFLLEVRPVAYLPAMEQVFVWPHLAATIHFASGANRTNEHTPLPGLRQVVLNPELLPAASRSSGNYLIVVASAYQSTIASFATAKQAQGLNVTTYVAPSANATTIKNYIQSLWGTANEPEYVLLVGDTDTIPSWTGGGEGTPDTDLPYSCMDGSTDWYPDLALGRFSVRSTTELQAIIDKTLYWENGPLADPNYVLRAVFMASEDNYTVSEGTHNWVISNYMTPNGITAEKLYTHTYSATTAQVRSAFNAGRFFGIYSGHGASTYWADGPVFYQSDVRALTNTNMYPFVCSFACVTGDYANYTECFTETWIRQTGKGALAIYGSSVNSYWDEDDALERRLFDSIYDTADTVPSEVAPVWNEARVRYLAQMGSGSTTRRYFEMYNLMGDPSLPFPNAAPDALTIEFPNGLPSALTPGSPTNITVRINEGDENYIAGTGALHYRYDGGAFHTVSFVSAGGNLYTATLPAATCDDDPEFYFTAQGSDSGVVYQPSGAPGTTYSAVVGEMSVLFADDFETNKGWTVTAGATTGNWERADPEEVDNSGTITQPGDDHTAAPGTLCYVTGPLAGASAGTYDLDGGPSVAHLSAAGPGRHGPDHQLLALVPHQHPMGRRPFLVEVSNNNGGSWTTVESIDDRETWTYAEWKLADYVTPTDQVLRALLRQRQPQQLAGRGVDRRFSS